MKYVAVGSAMINNIYYPDGKSLLGEIGGGGLYGTFGLRLWDDNVVFAAGIGLDFDEYFGKWFKDNALSRDGLSLQLEKCTCFKMVYEPDGQYEETPEGGTFTDFGYLLDRPEEIAKAAGDDTKGIYMIMETDLVKWEKIFHYKEKQGFKIMWEIGTGACVPENRERIEKIASRVEFFSINLPETKSAFSVDTEAEALEALKTLHTNVLFRVGKKGLYVILADGTSKFYGTIHLDGEIDPTGCGNSSTAAALYAYCEGGDIDEIGVTANVTSAFNVQYKGLCRQITPELREKARTLRDECVRECRKGGNPS